MMTQTTWKPNGEKCPHTNLVNGTGVAVMYNDDGTERIRIPYKDGKIDFVK
jgi:antitoxin component YwqK of YwqJK toxin-antitoxin module